MPRKARYYVYFVREGDDIVYIGKGSGQRINTQRRRFGLPITIEHWFTSEAAAFRKEAALIKLHRPRENKVDGGRGGVCGKGMDADMRLIRDIGTQAFAARLLLSVYKIAPHLVDSSKLDKIRQVAHG